MTESPRPQNDRDPSGGSSGAPGGNRPDQSRSSGRFVLYLLIAAALLLAFYPMFSRRTEAKTLKFSEFVQGVKDGKWTPLNVHEFEIGKVFIRFQDQSLEEVEKGTQARAFQIPVGTMDSDIQKALTDLLDSKGIAWGFDNGPSDWQFYILLIMILALPAILLFILMLRRIGGAGSALAFGRSRGRVYAQEEMDVTFNDVAGIDEAVEELKEVVEFLKSPQKYQALGGRIPKGVLLVGPPGTGKTLLAKAVAGEADVPFISLSGSDFVEMFVGVGAARVRDMFQQAAQRSPCIIFIDELDALGKARSGGTPGSHDEREQTLNALLVEMDGFGSDQSVIVMAATNRIDVLDPALLRPGRFDRHVMVDRPDIRGREQILKVHSTKVKIDETVDLARVARLTAGFVGADLANLVNEAALLAARKGLSCVTMEEFDEGFERVVAGLEKQSRVLDEEEKERTAYHECGHALVSCSLPNGDPVHKISIIPRGMALGYVMHRPDNERHNQTRSELINRICGLLGGIASEQIVYEETSVGAQNDLQRASDIARRMVTEFGMSAKLGKVHYSERRSSPFLDIATAAEPVHSEETIREIDLEVKKIIDECYDNVIEILTDRRATLDRMAKELLEVESMDADHLKQILDEQHPGPQIVPGTHPKPTGSTAATSDSDGSSDENDDAVSESV